LVKSADALSFFDVNFDIYMAQAHDIDAVRGKMRFMYEKMCGRTYDDATNRIERRVNAQVQHEVRDYVESVQQRAEALVLPMYEKALAKVKSYTDEFDPRHETTRLHRLKEENPEEKTGESTSS